MLQIISSPVSSEIILKYQPFLCLFFQEGTNVQGVADRKDTTFSQPYLVMTVGIDKKSHQYFFVLDKTVVQAREMYKGLTRKAHHVFNVEYRYAWVLEPFYQFVAAYIYNVLPQSQVS